MNPYKKILQESLPRLINMINLDESSDKYGFADRQFWGWKTIDFPNGTYQGIAHAIAIAVKLDLLENKLGLKLVDALIRSIPKIAHKNGAVEEAFPEENSFCVTALLAFDTLSAIYRLQSALDKKMIEEYIEIVRPLMQFITDNDETHAIISNHLATGVAAIAYWNALSGDNNNRYKSLLDIIYRHQSDEGWFMEYEGADPGYQTLCTYYLAAAHEILGDDELDTRIKKSISFLSYFVHPDRTIGGLYGSRNTEVYYPGGIAYYAHNEPIASVIDSFMLPQLKMGEAIVPLSIDRENLIPLINSYAYAALHYSENTDKIELPCKKAFNKNFQKAGVYVYSNSNYYAIVNYKKGGVIKVFDKQLNSLDIENGGILIAHKEKKASTQIFDNTISFSDCSLTSKLYYLNEGYPTYFQFMLIRLFALTIFKVRFLREAFKKAIIKLLITGKKQLSNAKVLRKFDFSEHEITVKTSFINLPDGWEVNHVDKFKSIHMASSGYNTLKNIEKKASKRVKFIVE